MASWLNEISEEVLRNDLHALMQTTPEAIQVINRLYEYLGGSDANKRRKISGDNLEFNGSTEPERLDFGPPPTISGSGGNVINIESPLNPEEIIFDIQQVSFWSPLRKKLNLTFHLIEFNGAPTPILSIVNPSTMVPEFSLFNLSQAVRLCVILPILGNSTNPQKKNVVTLCFWLVDGLDPIVLQVNLDQIKKQLIKQGKIPANIENSLNGKTGDESPLTLSPVQDLIMDYFVRQFQLIGINLANYLPSSSSALFANKYILNSDNAIAMATKDNASSMVIIEAHKGSKDGSLVCLAANGESPAYMIFGFKKPILIFERSEIMSTSYANITNNTFSILISVSVNDEEKTIEFGMIDQKYHQVLDDFIKNEGINDDSFNDQLREKSEKEQQAQAESQAGEGTENGVSDEGGPIAEGVAAADDDDEGDDDYHSGLEEEESDVAEEYDSDHHSDDGKEKDDEEEGLGAEDIEYMNAIEISSEEEKAPSETETGPDGFVFTKTTEE